MSVKRTQNWLHQQRVDTSHLKAVESSIQNDFDELIATVFMGLNASYIVRGFEINTTGAIGNSANSLQMIVDNSAVLHGKSVYSGTFLQVPPGTPNEVLNSVTNTKVQGSFTPGSLNYIGLEIDRAIDSATNAQVFFWNPTSKSEFSRIVPLAETLSYKIIITTSIWASNVIPVSVVETDASNNVVSIQDRRPMLFRLGTGGQTTPDPFYTYPWTNHSEGRVENFWESSSSTSPFRGGDKQILHLKEWMDAVMSSLKEIKGTTYWYSFNSGGSIIKLRGDLANTQMTGSGVFSHAATVAGQINWSTDFFLKFIGSRLKFKIEANQAPGTDITLADNQVAYVKLIRGVDVGPNLILTNGSPIVTSVGAAPWTTDLEPGDFIKVGSLDDTKYFEIQTVDSASQVTLTENYPDTSTGSAGVQCKYAFGVYRTSASPSTDRHLRVADRKDVPFNEDTFWLFLRSDDGGTAQVFIRGSGGGELEQGEEREISDNQTSNILNYVGSPSEVDTTPNYTDAITVSVPEITEITFPAGSVFSTVTPEYFTIYSAKDTAGYYVYPIVDGNDNDPAPVNLARIGVAINSTDSDAQVASAFAASIGAVSHFNTSVVGNIVTVTNVQKGETTDASNVSMPAGFLINITQQGAGSYNYILQDNENLTAGIKRLDQKLIDFDKALNGIHPYEEFISIVSGAPSNDNELSGPIPAGTNIKIPKNTRNANIQEEYGVGNGDLHVYLNGQKLSVGYDYTEVSSTEIAPTFELPVGYILTFVKPTYVAQPSSGSAANGSNLGAPQDADVFSHDLGGTLYFRRLKAGAGMNITENTDDVELSVSGVTPSYSVFKHVNNTDVSLPSTSQIFLIDGTGTNITVTLPSVTDVNVQDKILYIKNINNATGIILKTVNNETIDGVNRTGSGLSMVAYESITLVADPASSGWFIL